MKITFNGQSFCLDSNSTELGFNSLREFTSQMEKLGLRDSRAGCAVGFENPVGEDRTRFCSLMWVSESESDSSNRPLSLGRIYPFIVGLNYQIRCRKYLRWQIPLGICVPSRDSWSCLVLMVMVGLVASHNGGDDCIIATLVRRDEARVATFTTC
ncbi:hypothetical protein HAX54_031572 [Datura stramonium]|uniref:Uncharacterized protein n=1 Tax=Datura stramonium TaxID=4076 RepID=A0ABS8RL43_DATST|nr:hypothetical protein [Datura stramonium]